MDNIIDKIFSRQVGFLPASARRSSCKYAMYAFDRRQSH